MDVIALIGRILFVAIFIGSGIAHLTQTASMAGYAASQGIPQPKLAVAGSGVLVLVGGLMVLLGVWADLGLLLLVLFLLPTAFLMHAFWKESDAQAKQMQMIQFQKNVSISGASLIIFALYVGYGQDLGLMITGPLFG